MRFCLHPGCGVRVPAGFCSGHRPLRDQARRDQPHRRLYRTERWKQLARRHLARSPWCVGYPPGIHEPHGALAQCVDHIQSARQYPELFFDPANHQSLCHDCNRRKSIAEEGGFGAVPPER